MNAQQLRNSILQEAIEGRLVPQDPNDEPASVLLNRIREEKKRLVKEGKLKKKDLEETPISEDEKPFEIPESWEWVRLGDTCTIKGGKRIPVGYTFADSKTNHIYIRVSDMKRGTIVDDDLHYISDEVYNKISQYIITSNDLYMTIVGATIGKCGIVPEFFSNHNLTENAARIIPYTIDKYFLLYCLNTNFCQSQFVDKTNQVGVQKMALTRFSVSLIPLPPLAEQKRIVAKIEELLPKVEEYGKAQDALNKLNEELPEKLKKSVLQEAIEGRLVPQDPNDEPASVLLDKIRAEKKQLVKEGKLKKKDLEETPISEDEKPFEIPDSWEWVRLSCISKTITKGTTPRGGKVAYSSVGIGFLRAENIAGIDKLDLSSVKYVTDEEHRGYLSRSILEANDLLITIAGTLGRTALVRESDLPLNANQAVSLVRLVDAKVLSLLYIIYALNAPSVQETLTTQKKVTAIPNLTLEIIGNCIIPLPPLAEQKRIVAKIEEVFKEIDKLK